MSERRKRELEPSANNCTAFHNHDILQGHHSSWPVTCRTPPPCCASWMSVQVSSRDTRALERRQHMQDGQSGKPLWNNSVRPAWCALIAGRQLKLLHAKTICTDPLFALLAAPLAEAACRLITWWISAHRTVPASLFTCTWQAQESCREMDRCTGLQARERRHVHLCTSKAAVDSRQPAADQLPPRLGTPARPARVQAIRNSDFVLEAVGSYSGRVQLRAGWRHRVRDCLDCFPRGCTPP